MSSINKSTPSIVLGDIKRSKTGWQLAVSLWDAKSGQSLELAMPEGYKGAAALWRRPAKLFGERKKSGGSVPRKKWRFRWRNDRTSLFIHSKHPRQTRDLKVILTS